MTIILITIMSQHHSLEHSFRTKEIFQFILMVGLYSISAEIFHFNSSGEKLIC